ncbi:hypothetical protein HanRHA438_Chr16g0746621 [Helianthus annuus]|nr:hypothetical protein HanRHA438_Chr16g0746621 [Helianthus annuus]
MDIRDLVYINHHLLQQISQHLNSLLPSPSLGRDYTHTHHHFCFKFKHSKCDTRCKKVFNEAWCWQNLKDHLRLLLSSTFPLVFFPSFKLVVSFLLILRYFMFLVVNSYILMKAYEH